MKRFLDHPQERRKEVTHFNNKHGNNKSSATSRKKEPRKYQKLNGKGFCFLFVLCLSCSVHARKDSFNLDEMSVNLRS